MRPIRITSQETILDSFATMSTRIIEQGVPREIMIGYRGGSETVTVYWNKEHNFWSRLESDSEKFPDTIFCTCGQGEPVDGKEHPITMEINIHKNGESWLLGGIFVRDSNSNKPVLAHTGKISGNRSINRDSFLDSIPAHLRPTIKNTQREVIIIGDIESSEFVQQLGEFVNRVAEFRKDKAVTAK
ncbi:MAG: hypothetical protein NTX57_11280 [Armatimonadetes bacterium]|nr:hypothetical protein [Armatimonadota bacterium]